MPSQQPVTTRWFSGSKMCLKKERNVEQMDMKIKINYDNTTFYDTVSEREGETL